MYAMVLRAALNIVIDPIFIYTFKMGIAGAAWATLLSLAVSSAMMLNWLFFKKDTFVSFDFKDFSFEKHNKRHIPDCSPGFRTAAFNVVIHARPQPDYCEREQH